MATTVGPGAAGRGGIAGTGAGESLNLQSTGGPVLLIATRKGAFALCGDAKRRNWTLTGPIFLGHIANHFVMDPRDPQTVWVFPMDGTDVWPRTSPGGRAALYVTHDGGQSWERQDNGLPQSQAWFTVKRQAMTGDAHDPVGLYFGTTSGEVWASRDEGASWRRIAQHLPHIYSLEVADLAG